MKVLFLTNIPSPYTTDFFNELGIKVDLTVLYERKKAKDRNLNWYNETFINYKGIFLKSIKFGKEQGFSLFVLKYLKKKFDIIILGNFTSPTGILAISWMKLFNIPYMLFSEGGIRKNGKGIKEKIKKKIIKNADLYLSTSTLGDEYFIQYGAKKELIRRIVFTTIYENDIKKRLEKYPENEIPIVISVGRFIEQKGFLTLLEASKNIVENIPHKLIIIGGGPEKSKYIDYKNNYNMYNVTIIDHIDKDELKKYYDNSDLFVLPTYYDTWGLVIIEAMSRGLPIISTNMCVAAVELIKEDNGFIYEYNKIVELQNKMELLLKDKMLRRKMGLKNIEKSRTNTFEKMVEGHIEIFENYLKNKEGG